MNKIKGKFKYLNESSLKKMRKGKEIISNKPILKKVINVIVILILCVLMMFIFLNIHNLAAENIVEWTHDKVLGLGVSGKYPQKITGSKVNANNFTQLDNNLAVVSDTSFIVFNQSAKELLNEQHSLDNPILKVYGNKTMLYNLGGTAYKIQTTSKELFKGNANDNIIAGNISSSGRYAIVTKSKTYLCELTVFDNNEELYKYYFSEYYITDVAVSADGKTAAASGFKSDNGKIKSIVYIFDFSLDKPKYMLEYDGTAIFSIGFSSNKNLVAVGDNLTSFIKTSKGEKNDYSYEKKTLTCFDMNHYAGTTISLSSTEDKRNCKVIKFKDNGDISAEISTDLKVESVSSNKNKIALLSEGKILLYSSSGEEKGIVDAGNDAKKIQLNESNIIYILGINEIRETK